MLQLSSVAGSQEPNHFRDSIEGKFVIQSSARRTTVAVG